jgi:hypothetical protein
MSGRVRLSWMTRRCRMRSRSNRYQADSRYGFIPVICKPLSRTDNIRINRYPVSAEFPREFCSGRLSHLASRRLGEGYMFGYIGYIGYYIVKTNGYRKPIRQPISDIAAFAPHLSSLGFFGRPRLPVPVTHQKDRLTKRKSVAPAFHHHPQSHRSRMTSTKTGRKTA